MNTQKPDVIIVGHLGGIGKMCATDLLVERLKTINHSVLVVSPEKERGLTINEIIEKQRSTPIKIQKHDSPIHLGKYKDGQANRRDRRKQKRKKH